MKMLPLSLLAMLTLACLPAMADSSPACPATAADAPQVVHAVESMYRSAMADDVPAVKAAFTADGYLYDGGSRYTPGSIMAGLDALRAKGMVYAWSVTEPDVHVDCHTAWIAFVNQGSVSSSDGKKDATWLESAELEKQAGVWRIRFFQSTQVPPAAH